MAALTTNRARRFCAQQASVCIFAHGNFFAVADRRHAIGSDTQSGQVIHRRLGALGAKRHVVIRRAAFIAMTFDLNTRRSIGLEPISVAFQRRAGSFRKRRAVEIETDIFQRSTRRRLRPFAKPLSSSSLPLSAAQAVACGAAGFAAQPEDFPPSISAAADLPDYRMKPKK